MKKKLFYLLTAITTVFTSCSNDAGITPKPPKSILPKTISYKVTEYKDGDYTKPDGFSYQTNSFVFDGNKIVSVSVQYRNFAMKTVFTYTGNLITKAEGYMQNVLVNTTSYVYENGKLKEEIYILAHDNPTGNFYFKKLYTHKSDGTVEFKKYYQDGSSSQGIKVLTFKDGNLIKEMTRYDTTSPNTGAYEEMNVYKYDSKNNPLKNILGLNLIALEGSLVFGHDMSHADFGIIDFGINNIIEKIKYVTSSSSENVYEYKENLDYKYDVNEYPLEKKSSLEGQDDIQFTYSF